MLNLGTPLTSIWDVAKLKLTTSQTKGVLYEFKYGEILK